jgi:hypothetical protein
LALPLVLALSDKESEDSLAFWLEIVSAWPLECASAFASPNAWAPLSGAVWVTSSVPQWATLLAIALGPLLVVALLAVASGRALLDLGSDALLAAGSDAASDSSLGWGLETSSWDELSCHVLGVLWARPLEPSLLGMATVQRLVLVSLWGKPWARASLLALQLPRLDNGLVRASDCMSAIS